MSIENIMEDQSDPKNPPADSSSTVPSDEGAILPDGTPDWKTRAEKAKETAENYKREIEAAGIRKPKVDRVIEPAPAATTPDPADPNSIPEERASFIRNDYLSKRVDVIEDFKEEINGLEDEEWARIEPLLTPALDGLFLKAAPKGNIVARGEIQKTIKHLINFAKGEKKKNIDLEEARSKGVAEARALEQAEIPGARPSRPMPGGVQVTDVDKKYSEESGGNITPERAAEIRIRKAERAKEYSPNDWSATSS